MSEEEAIEAFAAFLDRKAGEVGEELTRMRTMSQRLSAGWAFFYQSRTYVETGDPSTMLVGHGPVVVKDDGGVVEGGSLDHDPERLLSR